jgi:hypothetical protein
MNIRTELPISQYTIGYRREPSPGPVPAKPEMINVAKATDQIPTGGAWDGPG